MSKSSEYKTLLSTLAHGATNDSRDLLRKYGNNERIRNEDDLILKLGKIYAQEPDKVKIETDFAKIHPHSKFILKYLSRAQTPAGEVVSNKPNEKTTEVVKSTTVHDGYSNADGMKETVDNHCSCQKCKCMYLTSNPRNFAFDGTGAPQPQPHVQHVDYVGMIGVIAVTGLIFYALSKSKI